MSKAGKGKVFFSGSMRNRAPAARGMRSKMMIWYDWMSEGWCDTENDDFFVDMTPEGGVEITEFETMEKFLLWYNGSYEEGDNND
jgi:hypothetical protein